MKKVFSGAKETHPDILRGGHRNQYYQLENAIRSGGKVFCLYHLYHSKFNRGDMLNRDYRVGIQ